MVILLLQRKALIFLSNTDLKLNTNAEIEIQLSDSTTGMNSVMEGTCDIGKPIVIENSISNLKSDQIRGIFKGEIVSWNEIIE